MTDACPTCGSVTEIRDNFCRNCGTGLSNPTGIRHPAFNQKLGTDNARVLVGIFAAIVGALSVVGGYLFGIIPLVALGVSALILAIMVIYLLEPGKIRSQVATSLSLSSLINLERLLEELYLSEKGIYVPAGSGMSSKVFIPLIQTDATINPPIDLTNRKIVFLRVGTSEEERGVLLEAPGNEILYHIEQTLAIDAAKANLDQLREALSTGLKFLGLGRNFNLERKGDKVEISFSLITLTDLEAKMQNLTPRVVAQIGGPLESALMAAVAKASHEYVTLEQTVFVPSTKGVTVILGLRRPSSENILGGQ